MTPKHFKLIRIVPNHPDITVPIHLQMRFCGFMSGLNGYRSRQGKGLIVF